MEIIRRAADVKCSGNLQLSVQIIDGLLGSPLTHTAVKSLFGVAELEHDEDFASLIEVRCGFQSSLMLQLTCAPVTSRLLAGEELGPRSW